MKTTIKQDVKDIIEQAGQKGWPALSEYDSKRVVALAQVPVTKEILAQSREEAITQAARIGFPVVLKGSSPALSHKTEMDMVRVNLKDAEDVGKAYDELTGKGINLDGILISEMVKGSREFVIGLTRDPQFGPCVMFGIGGIFTEALQDVTFRVAPLTEDDAHEMMNEIKAIKLLGEFRGERVVNREILAQALVGIGNLGLAHNDIAEIDINPLIISDGKPIAVDALVILKNREK